MEMIKQSKILYIAVLLGFFLKNSFLSAHDKKEELPSSTIIDSIHVIVGPSGKELEPMALMSCPCKKKIENLCNEVVDILTKDMKISGFFKILPLQSFIAEREKETLVNTNFSDWFNIGTKYLIKSEVKESIGSFTLEMRLFNVHDKKKYSLKGETQVDVKKDELRKSVHKFANEVLKIITGQSGIFDSRILFVERTGKWEKTIFMIDMDGYGKTPVISNGSSNLFPRFGKGGKIIYTSFIDGKPDIFINKKKLTFDKNEYRSSAFSPDGKKIASSVDIDGQSDIVLLNLENGKILKNLTNNPADEISPSWSPDGSMIAFVSNRSGTPQIYVMNADGSGQRRLTMAGQYNQTPSFGKDGLIVFSGMDEFVSDIFTVDLMGNITRLTQNQGSNKDPSWSPDGRYIVFVSSRDGGWKIWIMTSDGRYQHPITEKFGVYSTPDWGY